jgi:hypothetical protein
MVFTCGMHASERRTRSHASARTSLRQIRSNNAWKRRSRLRLAATYRPRWELSRVGEGLAYGSASAVAVAGGVVGSCDHALTLTSSRGRDQSRAPSLDRPCRPASRGGFASPSVLWAPRTPARHGPLSHSAYRDRLRLTWGRAGASGFRPLARALPGRRDGSLLFRTELCPHALLSTPRASCTAPV